jgi:fatty acid desaturase
MLFRCILTIVGVFYLQYLAVTVENRAWTLLIAVLIGVSKLKSYGPYLIHLDSALVGFMPLHEGSHFSLTRNPWIWRLLGAANDFGISFVPNISNIIVLGASYYTWMHQHFLGHHPYTNVSTEDENPESLDPDVVTGDPDVRRIKPNQKWYSYYRYQAVSVVCSYQLSSRFTFQFYILCWR